MLRPRPRWSWSRHLDGMTMDIDLRVPRLFLLGAALVAGSAIAQGMPSKIRFVVPFAATGPTDLSARVLAEKLRAQLGIPVIVENRPSANGTIAAGMVKQAAPDGETLLYTSSGMLTITPHIEKSLPYDAFTDFEPVTVTCYVDVLFVTGSNVPGGSVKDFISSARSSKPSLSIASSGNGSLLHGYFELLKDAGKVELLHVPYKGAGPAFADVLSGQVNGIFVTFSLALPHVRSGKLKAFGVVGTKRSALAPEIPTFEEQGYPGFPVGWNGILAPKGTSLKVITALAVAMAAALETEEVRTKLIASGMTTWIVPGDEFARTMRSESDRWKKLLGDKGSSS